MTQRHAHRGLTQARVPEGSVTVPPHTLDRDTKERKGKHAGTYFASSAKAMTPATMGAETEVPVWPSVQ